MRRERGDPTKKQGASAKMDTMDAREKKKRPMDQISRLLMLPHFERNYGSTGSFSQLQIASSRVAGSCLMTWIFFICGKDQGRWDVRDMGHRGGAEWTLCALLLYP